MIDQEARGRIAELEAQIGQLRGLAGGLQGVLRQLTDGRITTLHQHPFTPDANYDEYCGDWELNNPDAAIGLPSSPVLPGATQGDGNLLYLIDYLSGTLYRTRNALDPTPSAVVYENCGVIGANPMTIILNPFDPKNSAMAQCYHGVYRTDNLNDDTPTWTLKADLSAPSYLWHGAASMVQKDLWLVVGFWNNVGAGEWYSRGWVTLNGGEDWTSFWIYPGVEGKWCKCELSSHDATKAWVQSFHAAGGAVRACASSNINGGAPTFSYTTLWSGASDALCCNPYHRFLDNDNDLIALWAGEQGNAPVSGRTKFCTNDAASCTEDTLGAFDPRWCGGYTWGTDKYWVLCDYNKFFISSDGLSWTLQSTLPGGTRAISGWPYLGGRFYAAQDGVTAPLLVSSDEGVTWTAQTGNWAEVGGNKDIYSLVPVWVA